MILIKIFLLTILPGSRHVILVSLLNPRRTSSFPRFAAKKRRVTRDAKNIRILKQVFVYYDKVMISTDNMGPIAEADCMDIFKLKPIFLHCDKILASITNTNHQKLKMSHDQNLECLKKVRCVYSDLFNLAQIECRMMVISVKPGFEQC